MRRPVSPFAIRCVLLAWLALFASPAFATLALDGSAVSGSATSGTTVASSSGLTTTNSGDIIVAVVATVHYSSPAITVSSISGGSLTWAQVPSAHVNGQDSSFNYDDFEIWYAVAASPLSAATITATVSGTLSGSASASIVVAAVSGANTSSPFDADGPGVNSNLTSTASDPTVSISTTNANTFILAGAQRGGYFNGGSAPTGPTTPTGIARLAFLSSGGANVDQDTQYFVVAATQSSTAITWGTSVSNWLSLAVAIDAAGAAASAPQRALTGAGK